MSETKCADCPAGIDPSKDKYYQGVPGVGDLCLGCHGKWMKETDGGVNKRQPKTPH